MANKKTFNEVVENNLGKLRTFVPVVDRVHGPSHPEFHEVKVVFEDLNIKIENNENDLNEEFSKLRTITNDYLVPGDVCESYEAVYNMLEELDEAYNK